MIRILDDPDSLSEAAAQLIVEAAGKNIDDKGNFSLVLSGGETPRATYTLLASSQFRNQIDWKKVSVFFGDERHVPHTSTQSNYRMAYETLLSKVPVSSSNIFPIPTDSTPENDAKRYEDVLKDIFPEENPVFDLVLLGLGDNGHTASLFPHTTVLHEDLHWVKEVFVTELKSYRITLTVPSINGANEIAFLVSGIKKAEVLNEILNGKENTDNLPAQLIHPQKGELLWLVDRDAASRLK